MVHVKWTFPSNAWKTGEVMADFAVPESNASGAAPKPAADPALVTPVAPAAAAPTTAATPVVAPEVPATPRIKEKRPTQRSCDQKNEKGKLCCGHLKRWYGYPPEIEKMIGRKAEIYRCEFCQTLYKPDLAEMPHSYTLRY
jgi:hypothetical protein